MADRLPLPTRFAVFIGWGGTLGQRLGEEWHDDMSTRAIDPFISSIEMKGRAGEDLKKALRDQIRNKSDAYVLLCTRGAVFSEYVTEEILYAKRVRRLIIPYRVNGHPTHPLLLKPFHLEFDPNNPDYQKYASDIRESIRYSNKGISQTKKSKKLGSRYEI